MTLAVVTGGARGIGRATSVALAQRGLDVAVLGRGPGLEEVEREIAALGVRCLAIASDVSRADEVEEASRRVLSELGVPRVVVNSAGIVHRGFDLAHTSIESFDEVMAVNLRGPFLVTRAFLPAMLEAKAGRVIFVGSISSTIACPGVVSYAASKWGLLGLWKSLAEELRGTGVIALGVLPGSVDTDMLKGSGFDPLMTAAEVADTIVYAALDAPASLNGSAIEMFG